MKHNNIRFYSTLLLAGCGANALAQAQRPNIVWIMSDDHSFQTISAYGGEISRLAPTPHIDRIAQEGARFDDAFVENSLSTPARACLMTGLYSHQSGQRTLDGGMDTTKVYVSQLLQQAGYYTGVVGKWHIWSNPKGFNYYHIFYNQGEYYNPTFRSQDSGGKYQREIGYATDLVTEHAIEFLNTRDKSKPFFLLVEHKAPHRTWMPDIKYLGLYDGINFPLPSTFWDDYATRGTCAKQQQMSIAKSMSLPYDNKVYELDSTMRYQIAQLSPAQKKEWEEYYGPRNRAMLNANLSDSALAVWKYQRYMHDYMSVIHSVDESVGDIYEYLKRNNLLDNTIFVYCSDQGFYMGEHGWFDKRFMYEESLRTPLLIRYPKMIKPGTVDTHMVQNIDFAPTFLDAAGVKKPAEWSGRSLLDLFGKKPAKDWRTSIYYHYYDYPAEHHVRRHDGVRTDRYKLVHFYGKPMKGDHDTVNYEELYDLKNDPHELNNIYGKPGYDKITQQLQQTLDNYRKTLKVDEY